MLFRSGILFNMIGGNDLSMHEINAAAETITGAADPDANIIFGATIDPDVDGEVIITVVATGFDASYFTNRGANIPASSVTSDASSSHDDSAIASIDTTLDERSTAATDFHTDPETTPNIWAMTESDYTKKSDGEAGTSLVRDSLEDSKDDQPQDEDELDRPSFLRRLKKKHKENQDEGMNDFR